MTEREMLEQRLREALAEEYAADKHDAPGPPCPGCFIDADDDLPILLRALDRAGLVRHGISVDAAG